MPFKKGQSGNPEGKLKGTKTQKTKAWEAIGEYLIGDGAERYKKYLLELSEKDFSVEFKAIIEYFKPKLNRTDLKTDNSEINVNVLSGLSFEQLYELRYGKKPDR